MADGRIITEPTTTTTTGAESATTSTSATPSTITPVQQLAESSVVDYSRPAETVPSLTNTAAIITAASNTTPTDTSTLQKIQPQTTGTSTITTKPSVNAQTRPLVVNNLMIDPIGGTTTALTSTGLPGVGGGGFGGEASEPASEQTPKKKSWIPIILITAGILILFLKKSK